MTEKGEKDENNRSPEERERLQRSEQIFGEYLSRHESGESVDPKEFLRKHPGLGEELRKLFGKVKDHLRRAPGADEISWYLGDFKILREIGSGGMATVYEAEQVSMKRRVAVKILPPHLSISTDAVLKFRREAQAGGRQSHPGIVATHAVGEHDGKHYIVQELIEGGRTLVDELEANRQAAALPAGYFRRVARLVVAIADALQHAHDSGVIHRDVKPANILLTNEGVPKVTDFGLAKIEDALALSRTGDFAGTPYYMSPEQAASRRMGIDHRTDIFSLAVTLYEMLTLKRPFEGETSQEVLKKILLIDPSDAHKANPRVPRDLSTICLKAMEKLPEKRYQSMTEFSDDLRRYLSGDVILARPAGFGTRLSRRVTRNPVVSAALGIALLAVIALGVVVPWVIAIKEKEKKDVALGANRLIEEQRQVALTAEREAIRLKRIAEEEKQAAIEARNEAREQAALAETRYDEIVRLSDIKRLSMLIDWKEQLWPAHPENSGGMKDWLEEAKALVERFDVHRKTLESMKHESLTDISNSLWRGQWDIRNPAKKWQLDILMELVAGIEALGNDERGLIQEIGERLTFASTIESKSIDAHGDSWREAIASIADRTACPLYNGLTIEPQVGLVPIGRDRQSGLWEFAHLQTGAAAGRSPDETLHLTGETGLVFVLIPGGRFNMGAIGPSAGFSSGSPNVDPDAHETEFPVHAVSIDPFFLSKYEMTQFQWTRFTGNNPSMIRPGPLHPVEMVSWEDCVETVRKLGLRLPTESEWEYAARAGTATCWWTGNEKETLDGAVNICDLFYRNNGGEQDWEYEEWLDDGFKHHAPVGSFLPNPFGLHDVCGNVIEWCQDSHGDYLLTPKDGSAHESTSHTRRISRGGGWSDEAYYCRSACRYYTDRGTRHGFLGLRPACSLR